MRQAEQSRLDRKSKPLRDAFGDWARQFGWGWGGGWDDGRGLWRYEIHDGPVKLWVEVLEDGSAVLAWTDPRKVKSKATTIRGLRRVLDQLTGAR